MKYIDADLLRKEIEYLKAVHIGHAAITKETNAVDGLDAVLQVIDSLQQKQPESSKGNFVFPNFLYARTVDNKTIDVSYAPQSMDAVEYIKNDPTEQPEVDLEKFTEKMDAWKARYNYPDNIVVKGAMAFTARMFYMYPKVAREWYDSLPKVTMD